MERNNWNMLLTRNEFATYTLNSDATLMYSECDCEAQEDGDDDCYSESEVECNSFGGEWVIENDTLEISMSNESLILIERIEGMVEKIRITVYTKN